MITRTDHPRTLRLGRDGRAAIDPVTGGPAQLVDARSPERTFLLPDTVDWHSIEHRWGSGFAVTDRGAGRWLTPSRLDVGPERVLARYDDVAGLRLDVERTGGDVLRETYRWTNAGAARLSVGALAVQTPFADHYPDARGALGTAVHAHVFASGAGAWVAAQPMSGEGRLLGLVVRSGRVSAYSVESRNPTTLSDVRGHLVLHVTDHARAPHAFGGQEPVVLEPGASYELAWELSWYDTVADLLGAITVGATLDRLTATVGDELVVRTAPGSTLTSGGAGVRVASDPAGSEHRVVGATPGPVTLDVRAPGGTEAWRTEVLVHRSLRETVERRCRYVLDHQRATDRPGLLRHALVPVDTRTLLTQTTNAWSDWTDGSERAGMALLLQRARSAGWLDDEVGAEADEVLDGWGEFARTHLLDETCAPRRGSQDLRSGIRLYDAPWLSAFFLERHQATGDDRHLDTAATIQARAVELGAEQFLAIHGPETTVAVATALAAAGRDGEAADLHKHLVASAQHFLGLGTDLPAHEVAYEQSIVAPLLSLWCEAHRLTGDADLHDAVERSLPWLLAFGGPQPHVRLRNVAIRHWDGYWFGTDRLWGDVFPHHWSTLTAAVLTQLPDDLRDERTRGTAEEILRANLVSYRDDGSATCAFVMPSCVDGRPAHRDDPLANDQDWHLATWLRLLSEGAVDAV